jgi:hypothetical protein
MSVLYWSDVRQLRRKLIYSSACGLYNANNVKAGVQANIEWCLNSWDPLLFCELEDSDLQLPFVVRAGESASHTGL